MKNPHNVNIIAHPRNMRSSKEATLALPAGLAKKLRIKEGDAVEAIVKKGKLVLHKKHGAVSSLQMYAGLWEHEPVDDTFRNLRKEWTIWQKKLSA